MGTQGAKPTPANMRTGCGCLVSVVVLIVIIGAIAGGSGKSGSSGGSPSSASSGERREAQEYIKGKYHLINLGRVDYEHVVALTKIASNGLGEEGIDEVAKVAQEAHDEISSFREELFDSGAGSKLSEATFRLSEGANELKNAMGAVVAYTGNPNPASLAHFSVQMEAAQGKWNQAVDEIWEIAHEHHAPRLEASAGRKAAEAIESITESEGG